MIVKLGNIENEIAYEIDERITDGEVEIRFRGIRSALIFKKRTEKRQIEVRTWSFVVRPTIRRSIDEMVDLITIYYEENYLRTKVDEKLLFDCNIIKSDDKYSMEYSKYDEEKIRGLAEGLGLTIEQLAEKIYKKMRSGYSR